MSDILDAVAATQQEPDLEQVAEGRRRVCLQTAVSLLMHNKLLVWEVCDYAKYLHDYLKDGAIPRETTDVVLIDCDPKRH